MRRLILGTAGHIDHGKTALIRALTGTDTDRLPEEKRRGITIDLGFALLRLPDGNEVAVVDVPGHEAFIRNMLAGATGIDLALLVVAADEGVMPQTREHVAILELLGVRALVVALTKTDLVEPDWIGLATDDVRALLGGGPFDRAVIVPVSARTGQGLEALNHEIARTASAIEERSDDDLFRLPIDRVFTVHGTGTVVTGTVWSGAVTREQAVRLLPAGRPIRLRGLQSHGLDRDRVRAGERAAVALAATGRESIERGDVLVTGDGWEAATRLTLRLRALAGPGLGLKHGQRVRFHLATAEVIGRLAASTGIPLIEPGAEDWIQIRLERPVVARAGDPFVIRSFSPVTTIGGGRVAEPVAPRRKRLTPAASADLAAILAGRAGTAIAACTRLSGWAGESPDGVAVRTTLAPAEIRAAAATAGTGLIEGRFFDPVILDHARSIALSAIDRHHESEPLSPGIRIEHLRAALPAAAPESLAEALLAGLAGDGIVAIEANRVRRAGFRPGLDPAREAAAGAILAEYGRAGLAAPLPQELPAPIATRPDLDDLLHFLVRSGRLVALAPGRFLSPAALEHAVESARAAFGDRPGLTPGDFRDLFGISRKYLIPLLEHFDRAGVTVRDGDGRRMAPRTSAVS